MGRRVSSGINPSGFGFNFFEDNTLKSVEVNANLRLDADGTGIVEALKDLQVTNANLIVTQQGELRLLDEDDTNYVAIRAPVAVSADYTITLPAAAPDRNGYVLTATTAGVTTWEAAQSFAYSVQTGSFSAVSYGAYFIDTTSSGVTVTLPASPSLGDTIRFFDAAKTFDTNNLTVARNGKLIQGDAENLVVNVEGAAFELVFSNDTYGWRIFSV